MATSLRDIPGANRARPKRAERGLRAPSRRTTLDLTPGSLHLSRPRKPRFSGGGGRGFNRPSGQIDVFLWLLVLGAIAVAAWIGNAFWSATRVEVAVAGIDSGRALTPDAASDLDITIALASSDELFRSTLTIDGIEVRDAVRPEGGGTELRIQPAALAEAEVVEHALDEGEHVIELSVGRLFLGDSTFRWSYVVDSIAPEIDLPSSLDPVAIDEPVTVTGTVEEGVELLYAGQPIDERNGEFSVEFATPPTGALPFEAIDEAGNRTTATVVVPVLYPAASKAAHVSTAAWANDELRAGVIDLIDRGLIDTVQLDLKDESGTIGYDSQVPKAQEIGAVRADVDLAETVAELESRGVRVVGRLVAFRDPVYSAAAWAAGDTDQVLQTPDGGMLATYGGFTNYAHDEVRQYNLDIALEAVELGVHDILWDYIRRPEGEPSSMVVPGLVGPSSESVTGFLADTHAALRERGAYQGASVFGVAAAAGDSIAQDVPAMAEVVDYLAPMIYPSHWGPGMYRVDSPITQPYDITFKSLEDFQRVTAGTGVRLLPWLQDFTLYGVPYGPEEVKAQIDAAAALGIDGYFLWNPNVRYTADALTPIP
ncbi:MAG: putative glycoside hydrolase [Acidimicrobiales bacterium]